ncbi:hypothetical protein EON71_01310 [bacterium]|nr:MAG: hypothetical protein EON71_01310 [bacterium]
MYNFLAKQNDLHKVSIFKSYVYGFSPIEVLNKMEELDKCFYEIAADLDVALMDTYTLRRILDKHYVTNGIIYCGAAHSINYIYFLVKYFGFNITHASYSAVGIDKLNNIIKKCNTSDYHLQIALMLLPPEKQQCSNMENFPTDFK